MEDQATQAVLEFIERTQADEAVAESFLQVSIWSCGLMSRGNARGVVRNKGKGFHLTCGDATAGDDGGHTERTGGFGAGVGA
jgi:hypothetical protein